jgi:hypothetical protein
LRDNTTGISNTAIGLNALLVNTTGIQNTALGLSSLQCNTIGTNNTAVGINALCSNTTGVRNTAVGQQSLRSNTTGINNIGLGYFALYSNTVGISNVAIGVDALRQNTASSNTALGYRSLRCNTTGTSNTAVGQSSLYANTTGVCNTALGGNSGRFIADGATALTAANNSVFLGHSTRANADSETNQIVIGHTAIGLGSNTTVIGNTSTTHGRWFGNLLVGTSTNAGFSLDVNGTARVSGSSVFSGSVVITGISNTSTSSSLVVYGSGSSQPVFTVQGSQGELFSITDSLSGSLFSVNDISGLPILEVFSNGDTLIGDYTAPAVYTTRRVASTTAGVNVIYSLATSSYDGVFVDYTIRSGSVGRAGNFMAMWSGSSADFTDTSINGFGTTSNFVFGASISGSNLIVSGSGSTSGWTVKTIIRGI